MTLSEIFAAFICGSSNISENDLYLAKRSIVDTVGATIAGSRTEVVRQTLPVYAASGKSTVIGVGKGYSAQGAAFINGVSGHELELDDTCSSNLGHPTVAVLPAMLAVELGGMGLSDEQRHTFYEALELIADNLRRVSRLGLEREENTECLE